MKNLRRVNFANKEYTEENPKERDHCHITGNFRQAICSKCNISYLLPDFIPAFAHNLEGYDSHLIIKEKLDGKQIAVPEGGWREYF
ncbi:MAG TPA: endonuclease domain-containing protein [Bacteroidia bacterium]|nr:endonuclease domain-containing protein [Bacteroidia bacterium]